jgi:hypothetical protein
MKPGRELDAMVETRVLKWCVHKWGERVVVGDGFMDEWQMTCEHCHKIHNGGYPDLSPRSGPSGKWSTEISATKRLIEHMESEGYGLAYQGPGSFTDEGLGPLVGHFAHFGKESRDNDGANGEAFMDAVCIAALRAMGVEVDTDG